MTLQERIDISYNHISDVFDKAFITSLHRTSGRNGSRKQVRYPNQDGCPHVVDEILLAYSRMPSLIQEAIDERCLHHHYIDTHWNHLLT